MTEPGTHILLYDIDNNNHNNNLMVQHLAEQLLFTPLCSHMMLLEREDNPGVRFLVSYSEANLQGLFWNTTHHYSPTTLNIHLINWFLSTF